MILLLLPVALHAAVYGRHTWLRLLGAGAVLALGYVTLVGFTRATYAAVGIGLVVYSLLALAARRSAGESLPVPPARLIITAGLGLFTAVLSYRLAGSYGLACYGALMLLAYADSQLKLSGVLRFCPPAMAALMAGLALKSHMDSRWVEASTTGAVALVACLAAFYIATRRLFAECTGLKLFDRLFVLGGILGLTGMGAFALGGYQINDRLTRVAADVDTRESHWRDVIASASDGWYRQLFGDGVGSFPGRYIGAHPQKVGKVGSFRVIDASRRQVLQVGGGRDLVMGQRVSIEPHTLYTVTVHVRAEQEGRLSVALCERNVIYASNFMPHCVRAAIKFDATDGEFAAYSAELNSARLGERSYLDRWPTLMTLRYPGQGHVIDIDAVELSPDGFDMLRNASFNEGLDYWFYYNDFSHLPWHVKNTFLQVWFETGWLGMLLFLALLGYVLRSSLLRRSKDSLSIVYATALITLCAFGLFGSPLDSARVSWLFYFFMGAGVAHLRVRYRRRPAHG
jgi:hypothetical protein